MTLIETLALLGVTMGSLVGAPSSGWTESPYNAPTTADVSYGTNLPIIFVGPNENAVSVSAATVAVVMVDQCLGTASGLSGGDPTWRSPFATIKDFDSSGTTGFDAFTVQPGYYYQRNVKLYTETGSNSFSRSSGSPTTATRLLLRTWDNRPHVIYQPFEI
jgi:hypothetical protein